MKLEGPTRMVSKFWIWSFIILADYIWRWEAFWKVLTHHVIMVHRKIPLEKLFMP